MATTEPVSEHGGAVLPEVPPEIEGDLLSRREIHAYLDAWVAAMRAMWALAEGSA